MSVIKHQKMESEPPLQCHFFQSLLVTGPCGVIQWPTPTQWTWVWANSRSWWKPGKPGVLQSVGSSSQTRLSDLTTTTAFLWQQSGSSYCLLVSHAKSTWHFTKTDSRKRKPVTKKEGAYHRNKKWSYGKWNCICMGGVRGLREGTDGS